MGIYKELQRDIGYEFKDESLLKHALTHPSFSNENGDPKEASNQRLEFLGDAVLELISSDFLYHRKPVIQEGMMTKLRASLVCEPTLADSARELKIGDYIILGKGEEREGINQRDSVLSDAFEALIGAIYIDGGMACAREFVLRFVLVDIEGKGLYKDAKTMLQEYCSKNHKELTYTLLSEKGPQHEKHFSYDVRIDSEVYGAGKGSSKKKAEQAAAYQALLRIKAETGNVFKIH